MKQRGVALKDPFEQLDLRRSFDVDLDELARRYQRLSRSLHPDRFVREGASARRYAASLAADAQTAFDILADDYRRALFLLSDFDSAATSDFENDQETVADSEFLATQFEWREQFEDLSADDDRAFVDFADRLRRARSVQRDLLAAAFDDDGRPSDPSTARLLAHRLRFFDRLLEDVERKERRKRADARAGDSNVFAESMSPKS